MSRNEVLSLYRQIFRVAKTWKGGTGATIHQANEERQYIKEEARVLFKRNKKLSDPHEIRQCINEAKSRMEIGLHYRNPYPRPVNVPPMSLPKTDQRKRKLQERLRRQAKPIYLHSRDELDKS